MAVEHQQVMQYFIVNQQTAIKNYQTVQHGKIEPDASQLIDEVLADLFIHALQIANYYNVDLDEKYAERIQYIMDRSDKKGT